MQPQQPQTPNQLPDPQQMFQPTAPAATYQQAPVTAQPSPLIAANPTVQPVASIQSAPKRRSKLPFIIGGAVVLLLVVLTVVALVLGGKKATPKTATTDQTATTSSGPSAATSGNMQQNYDAISQSLSSLDDNRDFPAAALDDTSLAKN